MNARDFLAQVWPATGYYCMATPMLNQKGERTYRHAIHDNMADAYLFGRSKYKDTDVYFGIFTHVQDRVMSTKWNRMLPSRKRENMAQAKCLFLDLDVGKASKDKPKYASQADALAALARFIFRTGFPEPIVVSSGNGLHVYWPLKDPVDASDWKPHAMNLRALLDAQHVLYDPSRTVDTTSVLRMPATFNHKNPDNLKKVEVIHAGDGESDNSALFGLLALLGGHLTQVSVKPVQKTPQGNIVLGTNFPATDPDEVANECEQVRIFRDQKGNIPEHHWYAGIGVLAFCTGGRQAIHNWSSGHPNYSHAETEAKTDQWVANGSVASCAKLNLEGSPGVCQRCPHWGGQFKNPIVIVNKKPIVTAYVAPTPAAVVNQCPVPVCDPPKPYARTQGLSVTRWDDIKNLTITTLHEFDLYPISVSSGVIGGQKINNGVSTWVGREYSIKKQIVWRTFEVPNECLSDVRSLASHMIGHGWFAPITNDVAKYMSAYLRELKAHVGLRQQNLYMGWEDGKLDSFILNGVALDRAGKSSPCVMAKDTDIGTDSMTKGGTLSGQLTALSFYNAPSYAPHKFMILCALANPLLMATGHHGVIVNAMGDSGASKTTAMIAASSIWGDPTKFTINGTNRGMSSMARELRAMALRNLPTILDEITHMDPEEARTTIMSWTQPTLRATLTSQRTLREKTLSGYRSSYLLTAANASLHQIANNGSNTAGTANSARVLQLLFRRSFMVHTKAQADDALRMFHTHHGWLGEHVMSLAMPSIDLLFESVRAMVRKLDADLSAPTHMRFMTAAAAPVFVAGAFAAYHGLVDWDMDELYRWFVEDQWPLLVTDMRDQARQVEPAHVMRDFLNAHLLDTLVDHGRGNIEPCSPRTQLSVHRHTSLNETWVDTPVLRRWCNRNGTAMTTMIDALKRKGIVVQENARRYLGEGTRFATTRNVVLILDTQKLNDA